MGRFLGSLIGSFLGSAVVVALLVQPAQFSGRADPTCGPGCAGVVSVTSSDPNVTIAGTATSPTVALNSSPAFNGFLAAAGFNATSRCALTTSNASPSLATLTSSVCDLTSGSSTATVFTLTLNRTYTSPPMCIVQDVAAVVSEPTCTTTTTSATITYAAAPGAVNFARVAIIGNGP